MANNVRLQFQRDIPVQFVKYYLKPAQMETGFSSLGMSYQTFNGDASAPVKEKDGFYTTSMTNVPALHEEPRMPPENQVKTWMLWFYSRDKPLPPQEYWPKRGKDLYERVKSGMKVNDDVKKAAAAAIGDATTPEQKLQRLYDFCRTKIKNTRSVTSGLTEAEREKLKKNESAADTLKRGMGTGGDIDQLFAALATASGFEVRPAILSDRSDIFFDKNFTNSYFLRAIDVAVKVGSEWRFFEPGTPYIPFGMIRWQQEAIPALILDPKEAAFVLIATMREQSIGQGAVKERGPLRGLMRPDYNGRIEKWIAQGATGVRVSKIEPRDEPNEGRFSLTADFSAPGYGQLMQGRLLVFRPAIVSRRESLWLTEPARKHPVVLTPNAYTETTKIRLPAGFEVDELPDAVKLDTPFGSYSTSYVVKDGQLLFTRTLIVRQATIPVADYSKVRSFFERIRAAEQSPVVLVKK